MVKPEMLQNVERGSYSRHEMLTFIPNTVNTVLEVGCGHGEFSAFLKEKHNLNSLWGVEIVASTAEMANDVVDKLVLGDYESQSLQLPQGYFDCIVFNDVVEHFVDPWNALLYTKKLLSLDGCVVLSIPNVRYWSNLHRLLFHKDWKYESWGILDRTHLRFFTERSIRRMMNECGFEVLQLEGINQSSFGLKHKIMSTIFKSYFSDTKYMQFACVAKPLK